MLGEQQKRDLSFISDEKSVTNIKGILDNVAKQRSTWLMQEAESFDDLIKSLKESLDESAKKLIPMMELLLKVNPYFRPTVHECLKNAVFDPIRNYQKEGIINEMRGYRRKLNE